MIKHYEKTQKETLIKILVASRKEVEKLQNRNKERKQEIERLNNIINKKEQFLGDNIKRLEREVVKRDNIINEFDKWLENEIKFQEIVENAHFLRKARIKLQELKGAEKE